MINRKRFDAARLAVLKARARRDGIEEQVGLRYGPGHSASWYSARENRLRYQALAAYERAADRIFRLLAEGSPRNWTAGVPYHWVNEDLTYEDAIRPVDQPLSVVPPLSYGCTVHMT